MSGWGGIDQIRDIKKVFFKKINNILGLNSDLSKYAREGTVLRVEGTVYTNALRQDRAW